MELRETSVAYVCVGPSIDDPGRKRLWIIPKDIKAGSNPSLWLKNNQNSLGRDFDRGISHCTMVCTGDLPIKVEYHKVSVKIIEEVKIGTQIRQRSSILHPEVRCISAASHFYVDRLRIHTSEGNIDFKRREQIVTSLATQYWNDQKEDVYVSPTLNAVKGGSELSIDSRNIILNRKPSCPEHGLTVLYGPGGIGKTFLLNRLAYKFGLDVKNDVESSIPVFVPPPTLLHKQALENWLSQHNFGKLTLSQITTLLRYGLIISLIDALDEVVKGEARQGSQEFLHHIMDFTSLKGVYGRALLACRDYYLNSDRLVPDIIRQYKDYPASELYFGYFDKRDRRRYLQVRANLDSSHASKWATALETQAAEVLGREATKEIEELIGHPVVLDTLSRYILDLPISQRMTQADAFKLTSSDIFGQIVNQLLQRERDKLDPSWRQSFKDRLKPSWLDPMENKKQRNILQKLTLLVASDGAVETDVKAAENDIYKVLRHGVFLHTKGVSRSTNKQEAMQRILRDIMGTPEVNETISEKERDSVIDEALAHLSEAYLGHILANTEPGLPDELIFAFRHRTYFDYLLADALITKLEDTIRTKETDAFFQWCQVNHIFDIFSTCFDFILWDPRINGNALKQLNKFIETAEIGDDFIASYVVSLALTLFIRRGLHLEGKIIEGFSLAPYANWELLLIKEMLPPHISGLVINDCSFPNVTIDGIDFEDVSIQYCDFETLRLLSSTLSNCRIVSVECKKFSLGGTVCIQDSKIELEEGDLIIEDNAKIEIHNCEVSRSVIQTIEAARLIGANVIVDNVVPIQPKPLAILQLTNGVKNREL